MGKHLLCIQRTAGSSPASSTFQPLVKSGGFFYSQSDIINKEPFTVVLYCINNFKVYNKYKYLKGDYNGISK